MRPFVVAHGVVYEMAEYALKNGRARLSDFLDAVDSSDQDDYEYSVTREQCEDALQVCLPLFSTNYN